VSNEILELEQELFKAVMRYIATANPETLGKIVNEVLMLNDILVFDRDMKSLKSVESVCMNEDAIQLNIEVWGG
jgi:hypothetical protein